MTTAIKIVSDTLPDVLPRASIPFVENCLGLFFFGGNDASSRKNRINPAAPLVARGTGPASFTATSMFTSANANNYQTASNVTPHSWTVGGLFTGTLAANGVDPGPSYGWLPFCGGANVAALAGTIYSPGGGYRAGTLGSEELITVPQDYAVTYVEKFMALSERPTGLDLCMEDGGPGGGVCFTSIETPNPVASSAQPINFGQPLYGGTGFCGVGFRFNRPLTPYELNQVYLQLRRIQALRTGVPL